MNQSPKNVTSDKSKCDAPQEEQLKRLDRFIETRAREATSHDALHKFIRRRLKQFHISTSQEADIFHEAYCRARKAIEEGKELTNIPGWMRSTTLRIIREIQNKEKRQTELAAKLRAHAIDSSSMSIVREDASVNREIGKLVDFLEDLDEESQSILYKKSVLGFSWREIKEELNISANEAALRKKYQRMKEKLRSGL